MSMLFKKCLLFFFAIFFVYSKSNAQGINLLNKINIASPTAGSLGKFGDIPVSYHTGIPQINIPIYTIKAGPISLPISLSYHAGGVKVQEPASWVGIGWALNAGGVITRTVVGTPDERNADPSMYERPSFGHFSDYGYNNYSYNFDDPSEVLPYEAPNWEYFANGWRDGEPDLFFFNFGNYTGKFYFKDDKTPVLLPEADFKIEPYYNPTGGFDVSIQSFLITTSDGVKYYFGNTPGLSGVAPIEKTKPYANYAGTSSWFLNKITTPDEQFAITLSYVEENYGYHNISMFPISELGGPVENFESNHGFGLVKNVVNGVRLSKINFPNGVVNFSTEGMPFRSDLSNDFWDYNSDALNQSAKPLGSIQISDGISILNKFNFNYDYFIDNSPLPQSIQNFAPGIFTDKKRLKLNSVQETSGDGTIINPPYLFTYFNEQVPRRLSFGVDHWGFSNGITDNNELIPAYTKYGSGTVVNVAGANRNSIWPAMRAGTLKKIVYPTGGYSQFDFEANAVYGSTSSNINGTILNQTVHLYAQSDITNTTSFVTNGMPMNIVFNNSSNYSAFFEIKNISNEIVYSTVLGNGQVSNTNALTLPTGVYNAKLTVSNAVNLTGGCSATITQWHTLTTQNMVTIGGNRIKTITTNDGVTLNNNITNYVYNYESGNSTAILYSRPVYVGVVRNDLIKDIGYYKPTIGFVQYQSINGCLTFPDAACFKSPNSIRPMATTQGSHIGYAQVKVIQSNNGYSTYNYYGSTNTFPWQDNNGDIIVQTVNVAGCDQNTPNFPQAPLSFDYIRGELKHEAHYNQLGHILTEIDYKPVFEDDIQKTPAFKVSGFNSGGGAGTVLLGTYYALTSARKTKMIVTETNHDPNNDALISTTSNTTFFESPFHNKATRKISTNSKNEVVETKIRYANDFRISTCDAILDGYPQYKTNCATCLLIYNEEKLLCNNNLDSSKAYFKYQKCKSNARISYVHYQSINFMDTHNNFKTMHDAAKTAADAELKPLLQLQDDFNNPVIETSMWKDDKLLNAFFNKYNFNSNVLNAVYPQKIEILKPYQPSVTFTNATTNARNTSIIKDNRYTTEISSLFYNGNLVEIKGKDGVVTSYIWGYNNNFPILKAVNIDFTSLQLIYNEVQGNAVLLRKHPLMKKTQLSTYTYIPLKGITEETNAAGLSVYYDYDIMGRLKFIKDNNGNILKKYQYQFHQ